MNIKTLCEIAKLKATLEQHLLAQKKADGEVKNSIERLQCDSTLHTGYITVLEKQVIELKGKVENLLDFYKEATEKFNDFSSRLFNLEKNYDPLLV